MKKNNRPFVSGANRIGDPSKVEELVNKNELTSDQSMKVLERLGRIIEMGQRMAKGTTP